MVTYKCKVCKKELKGGVQAIILDLIEHAEKEHPEEVKELLKDRDAYNKEVFDIETQLQRKYPNWNSGFVDLFEELPIKPRKLWKCPNCSKEMSYHLKDFHQSNRARYCKPKESVNQVVKERGGLNKK